MRGPPLSTPCAPALPAQALARQMLSLQAMLACAESCTGGLLAAACTDLPGASQWFDRGFVTYSNRAKTELLGVSPLLFQQYGAVSEAVAQAMAQGAALAAGVPVALATTGIAGPSGGSAEKPVGTVCFGFFINLPTGHHKEGQTHHFQGDRQAIRTQAVAFALHRLSDILSASARGHAPSPPGTVTR